MKLEIEFIDEQRQEAIDSLRNASLDMLKTPEYEERAQLFLEALDNGKVDDYILYEYYNRMKYFKYWLKVWFDELKGGGNENT